MTERAARLARLARAQAGMAAAVEAQLAAEERRIATAEDTLKSLGAALATTPGNFEDFRPALIRHVIAAERDRETARSRAADLRRRLAAARGREKALAAAARGMAAAEERREAEEEALETVLAMAGKASGKAGMVK